MSIPLDFLRQAQQLLTGTAADIGMLMNTLRRLDEFDLVTDTDYVDLLTARVTILGLLVKNFLKTEETESLLEEGTAWAELLTAYLNENSLLRKARQIIYDLQAAFTTGDSQKDAVAKALKDLGALPFSNSPFDGKILLGGIVQISALSAAGEYLQLADNGQLEANETTDLLKTITGNLLENGFDKAFMLEAYRKAAGPEGILNGNTDQQLQVLFIIYGLGLLVKPNGAPAMIIMEESLVTKKELTAAQFLQPAPTEKTAELPAVSAKAMVDNYRVLVEKDGFSEYAFYQAMAIIKAMPTNTDEDYDAFNKAMNLLLDTASEYAPANYKEMFGMLGTNLKEMAEWVKNPPPELSLAEANEIIDHNLADLKHRLAAGEAVDITYTRHMLLYTKLAIQIPNGDEAGETAVMLLKKMLVDGYKLLKPYVPADKKELWPQLDAMLEMVGEAAEQLMDTSETQQAKFMRRFKDQQERMIQAAVNMPLPVGAVDIPIVTQFVKLLPIMMERFVQLNLDADSGDEAEYKRLINQLDDTFNLLKSAYTLNQILEHQQMNLRRMALELAQFERRELLLAANPVFPANDMPFDANKLFFAGSSKTAALLQQACNDLWMHIAENNTTDNYVNNRWQLLRQAGIAVFDYSNFQPSVADPSGALPYNADAEATLLKAAGAIADIAYEHGLAYVLGKPVITVTKKDSPLPFDMDTDPVITCGTADDSSRMVIAIQKALYGISRATRGSSLAGTVSFVQSKFAGSRDKKIMTMLPELTNTTDATDLRFSIETIIDRNRAENQLLIIPAFAGGYPDAERQHVFHVTAFRTWSVATQAVTELVCKENKLEYRIGYHRLNPNILASIFMDISRASFVIADITNLNPNALLELAMAQALGRPTLIITQNKTSHMYCRSISQARVHYYHPVLAKDELLKLLNDFFKGKD